MGKYFGTDGFRGEANVKLTADHAFRVGRYLGWYYGRDHKAKIVIGKDTRRSSYMFEYALAAGLTASGADAYLLHVTTTPSVSYVVRTEDFDCGIMISASHNPFNDNGIKVLNENGQKISADIEARIEAYLDGEIEELPLATGEDIGCTVDFASGRNRYIGHLISIPCHDFKNIKVGLDCSNGSSSAIAKSVFDALRAKTYVINNEPNGTNINRGCGSTHIEVLRQFVVDKGLDIGFAYDGDADRCIAVDHRGNIIDGDKIMYVCGKYLREKGQLNGNTVVTTVMSNLGLYKSLEREGIDYEQTAVGHKYVAENMMANNYSIGGEQSGHIIFSRYAATGDGILTSLMVMEDLDNWAKSCFEKTDFGTHAAVSVVTKQGYSDDANGSNISGNTAWLKICRVKNSFAFHYSEDGIHYFMTRFFNLSGKKTVKVGLLAQAPQGNGGNRIYEDLHIEKKTVKNIRFGE